MVSEAVDAGAGFCVRDIEWHSGADCPNIFHRVVDERAKISFVQDNDGLCPAPVGNRKIALDPSGTVIPIQPRNKEYNVDICRNNLFGLLPPGGATRECGLALQHGENGP